VERAQAGTRFSLVLIGVFAAMAAVLTNIGLYGVLSTFVRQRTAEIGLRMAFGAGPWNIFRLVVGHAVTLSAAGIGIGILAAVGLTRMMATMLIGVRPTDPPTFLSIIGLTPKFILRPISSQELIRIYSKLATDQYVVTSE
jgi:putative ABC transport system permease protein